MQRTVAVGLWLILGAAGCRDPADTLLKQAAARGDEKEVRRLLAAGEDPDQGDHGGWPPLALAAGGGHLDTMRVLLAAGAAVDLRDAGPNGWTPLVHALHKNQNEAARVLLAAGAAADARMAGGATPLMFAAAYGNTEMVEELLRRGADPRAETRAGVTALANAAGGGGLFDFTDGPPIGTCHLGTALALLRRAPDLDLKPNFWNRTARRFARSQDCQQLYALLDRAGRKTPGAANRGAS